VRINDVNPTGVLSMTAVPVFRAHQGTRVFAHATGVEVVLAGAPVAAEHVAAQVVEQVSCLTAAKPAAWLKSLAEAGMIPVLQLGSVGGVGLEDRGYGSFGGRVRDNGTTGTNGTTTSTTGSTLIDPRDFRTSSPPG
jgi:hypothetical protein